MSVLRIHVALATFVFVVSALACGEGSSTADDNAPTACAADEYEPNDSEATARELPEMVDDPDGAIDLVNLGVHTGRDDDWFRIPVRDTGLGGDPVISVSVSAAAFQVDVWFVCGGGHRGTTECRFGQVLYETVGEEAVTGCQGADLEPATDENGSTVLDTGNGVLLTTDCSATSDDDGMLFIRVNRVSSAFSSRTSECAYNLSVRIE